MATDGYTCHQTCVVVWVPSAVSEEMQASRTSECFVARYTVTANGIIKFQSQWQRSAVVARIFCNVALKRSTCPSDCGWKVWFMSVQAPAAHTCPEKQLRIGALATVYRMWCSIPAHPPRDNLICYCLGLFIG